MRFFLRKIVPAILVVFTSTFLFTETVWAEKASSVPSKQETPKKAKAGGPKLVEISTFAYHLFNGKIEGDRGRFTVNNLSTRIRVWKIIFQYDDSTYSWDDLDRLTFGDGRSVPWKTLKMTSLSYGDIGALGERWRYFYSVGVNAGFESEIGPLAVGAYGGVVWLYSPEFMVRLGGIVHYHPVSTIVWPLIGLDYNTRTPRGVSFQLGIPSTNLTYHLNPAISFSARIWIDQRMFRLADDNKFRPKGYVEVIDQGAGLFFKARPAEFLELDFGLLYVPRRFMYLYDHDEDKHGSFDVDPTMGAVINIKVRF